MIYRIFFLVALPLVLIACKSSQNSTQDPSELILLLKEEVKPDELDAFEGIEILDQKRTSRSQNQWMVKLKLNEEAMKKLKDQLSSDSNVVEIISTASSENENFSNN